MAASDWAQGRPSSDQLPHGVNMRGPVGEIDPMHEGICLVPWHIGILGTLDMCMDESLCWRRFHEHGLGCASIVKGSCAKNVIKTVDRSTGISE